MGVNGVQFTSMVAGKAPANIEPGNGKEKVRADLAGAASGLAGLAGTPIRNTNPDAGGTQRGSYVTLADGSTRFIPHNGSVVEELGDLLAPGQRPTHTYVAPQRGVIR
jgi:hypothetical protein